MDKARLLDRLKYIAEQVPEFGSALDAEDRGYSETAREIEARATENIRRTLRDYPELNTLLPKLSASLQANRDIANSGREIYTEVEAAREQLAK